MIDKTTTETPSESGVEVSFLEWLDELGWETYGHDGGEGAHVLDIQYGRDRSEVIYWDILRDKIIEINEKITDDNADRFLSSLKRKLVHENLMAANQEFYQILQKGMKFTVTNEDGSTDSTYVKLIDFQQIENNRLIALNQFRVRGKQSIRPDINLFINGVPIVTGELKSMAQGNNYYDAINDLQEYESKAPQLFFPGLLNIAADTLEYRYGAVGASTEFYMPWKPDQDRHQQDYTMQQTVQSMLNPETLLDILENFVFYEKQEGGDVKIIPRYMQYYAVKKILERLEAGDHDRGLIWHTQGSGKSYTMIYAAKNLMTRNILSNPQVLVIVDTDKLRSQMSNTLSNIGFGNFEVAQSMKHLQKILQGGASKLVLTTIQMFEDVDPEVQGNDETVVMSDEAHRFMEKDLGTNLDAALPDAYQFGFTGTPVREEERDTFDNYCPEDELYLHRYSIGEGIEDELIVPVHFDVRNIMDWDINEEALDEEFETSFSGLPIDKKEEVIKKYITRTQISELRSRVEKIALDISDHFNGVEKNGWKGMVVTPSRKAAAIYGEELQKLRDPEEIEVLITAEGDDEAVIQQFHTTSEERESIVKDFKKNEYPKLLVVCDMLLTGFDAPVLKTMYLDRNLKNHKLLQAIARTNRPAEHKENGLIVDYAGVFENLDDALDYSQKVKKNAARDSDELLDDFDDLLEELLEIFEEVPKVNTQEAVSQAVALANEKEREFKQGFQRLQDLYETISPDKKLKYENRMENYNWLSKIFVAYQRSKRKEQPEEELRKKTKEIIDENIDIKEIKDNYPIYELSREHLEEISDFEPKAQATEIAHALQDHLQPRVDKNPRYKRLSQKVNEIINKWQEGNVEDPEAVNKLRGLEETTLEVQEQMEESEMGDAEYALYYALTEEYDTHIDGEDEAEDVAKSIIEKFEEEIRRDYDGWERNEDTRKAIRQLLIRVLVRDYGKKELYREEEFMEEAREYLIENYV